ncbi:MAG: dimethylamine monooxygenase subunit DmmA family protein [Betaproteobacteria bacterium]|jgi:predicted RNA-binding Zn-ribbon protein involved in translation (DUF1610 family)
MFAATGTKRGAAIASIKSQPVYRPLGWDPSGRFHLVLADCFGMDRVRELLAESAPPATRVMIVPGGTAREPLVQGDTAAVEWFATPDLLEAGFREYLATARMGLRAYLTGSEGFIWRLAAVGRRAGLGAGEMHLARCGTLARRVYCVHCGSFLADVRANVVPCSGCGRHLFVRDHFSRHHAAYMGFQIDAEVPGEVPPVEEMYP